MALATGTKPHPIRAENPSVIREGAASSFVGFIAGVKMNFSTTTLFFMGLIGSFGLKAAQDCPPIEGSHRLSAPRKMMNYGTVCSKLFGNNSCCSDETADHIQAGENRFNNFVGRVIVNLSYSQTNECENLFERLACLIECSPNFKNISLPKEIPLCKNTCELLYSACSPVTTCSGDWGAAMENETFDCTDYVHVSLTKQENLHSKVKSPEDFCMTLRGSRFFNVTDFNVDCYDLKTGKFIKLSDPGTSYHVFSYIGMTVIIIVICLASLYAVRYAMKRNRLIRGL
ncbi:hypothetical protein GE061_009514 [Apolygus lucorum]|uniref:Folate receptor-like domain-containing protein n=1 Tax=Apolygus lucorum TaxID=248454 RepID=A0A8S9Y2H1_APOLU|nr:hypothetical protein GE061_009514 [Apolygus lucorum]